MTSPAETSLDDLLASLEQADDRLRAIYTELASDPGIAPDRDAELRGLHARRRELAERVGLEMLTRRRASGADAVDDRGNGEAPTPHDFDGYSKPVSEPVTPPPVVEPASGVTPQVVTTTPDNGIADHTTMLEPPVAEVQNQGEATHHIPLPCEPSRHLARRFVCKATLRVAPCHNETSPTRECDHVDKRPTGSAASPSAIRRQHLTTHPTGPRRPHLRREHLLDVRVREARDARRESHRAIPPRVVDCASEALRRHSDQFCDAPVRAMDTLQVPEGCNEETVFSDGEMLAMEISSSGPSAFARVENRLKRNTGKRRHPRGVCGGSRTVANLVHCCDVRTERAC